MTELGLLALTVLFGLQVLRVLVPGLTWILGEPGKPELNTAWWYRAPGLPECFPGRRTAAVTGRALVNSRHGWRVGSAAAIYAAMVGRTTTQSYPGNGGNNVVSPFRLPGALSAPATLRTLFIEPGSPWENGYIESLNGKLRDELLNLKIFTTLEEAKVLIEQWRREYNKVRPHSAKNYRPPAPEAVLSLVTT